VIEQLLNNAGECGDKIDVMQYDVMMCVFVIQEWFPLREQLLSLSSGWLMFVAGILAVVYLWVKVCCALDNHLFTFHFHVFFWLRAI